MINEKEYKNVRETLMVGRYLFMFVIICLITFLYLLLMESIGVNKITMFDFLVLLIAMNFIPIFYAILKDEEDKLKILIKNDN